MLAYRLDTEDGAASFDELVGAVVQADTHSRASDRESVAISLDHHYLDCLAEEGLVAYERDRGIVRSRDTTAQVEPYFELVLVEYSPLTEE